MSIDTFFLTLMDPISFEPLTASEQDLFKMQMIGICTPLLIDMLTFGLIEYGPIISPLG